MTPITIEWLVEHRFYRVGEGHFRRDLNLQLKYTKATIEAVRYPNDKWSVSLMVNGHYASASKRYQEGVKALYEIIMFDETKA